MIKGIIFDADGTLLDSMHIWNELGARYLRKKEIEPEPHLDKILFSMSLEEGCVYLKKHYHLLDSTEEIAEDIIKIMENFYLYEAKAKNGAKDFLLQMKERNIPMIIATSSDKKMIGLAFQNLGIAEYFADIITCTELKTSKRKPDIYLHCAKIIGTKPCNTAVFEDVLHGIKAAKNAGFITYAVEDFSSFDDIAKIKLSADYYINDFTEIDTSKL